MHWPLPSSMNTTKYYGTGTFRTDRTIRYRYPTGTFYTYGSIMCCARNILTVHTETLTPYIALKRGRRGEFVLLYGTRGLATVRSCFDPSVRILTQYSKVGPLLIISISLICPHKQILRYKLMGSDQRNGEFKSRILSLSAQRGRCRTSPLQDYRLQEYKILAWFWPRPGAS